MDVFREDALTGEFESLIGFAEWPNLEVECHVFM
jgi:hypothetical protein